MSRILIACIALMFLPAALAQTGQRASSPIKWGLDFEKGVQESKKTKFPLMVWIVSRSDDRPEDTERDQKRAFQDAVVVELSKRYIPVQMSRSRYKDLLTKWGLGQGANLEIVFVTPEGDKIDQLGAGGVANASSLAQKMSLVFRKYRNELYSTDVKPVLENEEAKPAEVKAALAMVEKFLMTGADQAIIQMLGRPNVGEPLVAEALGVLATLSTRSAGAELFTRAQTNKKAAELLGKCTPAVAETLIEHLTLDDPAKMVVAYEAIGKICKIRDVKKDKFWDGKNTKIKEDELERVRTIARRKAREWSEKYEEYR